MYLPLTKKFQNIISDIAPVITLVIVIIIWSILTDGGFVPNFMLPSPNDVVISFASDYKFIFQNTFVTLKESLLGLFLGVIIAFFAATFMDRFKILYKSLYPLFVVSQTIPTIAIAPLLVLWMGFGIAPKVTLVVITTFFPVAIGLLDGYSTTDKDAIMLMQSMGAKSRKIFWHLKLPSALGGFFSGLKISSSYAVVSALVAEWMGGFEGLGVYMIRVKKAYAFDKMFAVIIVICIISLMLIFMVDIIQKILMPWTHKNKKEGI